MPTAEAAIRWEKEKVEVADWTDDSSVLEAPSRRCLKPLHIPELDAEIEQARRIINLQEDWDGEGSMGYSPYTLDRAIAFLRLHLDGLWRSCGIRGPIPIIGFGPHGSIDLHWKQPSWELLVNIPSASEQMAVFYGDNYGAQRIKGSLIPEKFNMGIAEWLMA